MICFKYSYSAIYVFFSVKHMPNRSLTRRSDTIAEWKRTRVSTRGSRRWTSLTVEVARKDAPGNLLEFSGSYFWWRDWVGGRFLLQHEQGLKHEVLQHVILIQFFWTFLTPLCLSSSTRGIALITGLFGETPSNCPGNHDRILPLPSTLNSTYLPIVCVQLFKMTFFLWLF